MAAYDDNAICVGLARLGNSNQKIVAGPMKDLLTVDFGPPLHSLIIPGNLHPMEEEVLAFFSIQSCASSKLV